MCVYILRTRLLVVMNCRVVLWCWGAVWRDVGGSGEGGWKGGARKPLFVRHFFRIWPTDVSGAPCRVREDGRKLERMLEGPAPSGAVKESLCIE